MNTTMQNSTYGMNPGSTVDPYLNISQEDVLKSLALTGGTGTTDAGPMVGESLAELVLMLTLSQQNNLPKYRRFYAYKAFAHIEQYNAVNSLGKAKFSRRAEADLGPQDSTSYTRYTDEMVYMGQTGAVTDAAQEASRPKFGDLKAREVVNRTTKLLLDIERGIWWDNQTLNPLAMNGLMARFLTDAVHYKDMAVTGTAGSRTTYTAGGALTISTVRNQMDAGINFGGIPTALYLSPKEKITLSEEEDSRVRWYKEKGVSRVAAGLIVDSIENPFGQPTDLVWDVFLNEQGELSPTPRDPSDATLFHADAPAILGTAPTGAAAAGSSLPNDVYYYGVSCVGDVDEGPIKLQASGYTADNTNGKVNITVTHPAHLASVRSYRLYRSTTSGASYATMRLVSETAVASSAVVGGTQVIADDGLIIPGSRRSVLMDETVTALPELISPYMYDLAKIDPTHRFHVEAAVQMSLRDAGKRQFLWKNIGGSVADPA